MKKWIALLLALSLMSCCMACTGGDKDQDTTPVESGTQASGTQAETTPDTSAPQTEAPGDDTTPPAQETTPAETTAPVANKTTEEVANYILEHANLELSLVVAPIEINSEYLPGLTNVVPGFNDGTRLVPMIGSIPFLIYIFHVEDEAKIDDFKAQLNANADPNWNICTSADTTICENVGSYVLFSMISLGLDGSDGLPQGTDQAIINAFRDALK